MSTARKRRPPAGWVKMGLTEGVESARGERDLATSVVPAGRACSGEEVGAIRTRRRLSQAQFASLLAIDVETLRSWGPGVRKPSGPHLRLLQVFDEPDALRALLETGPRRALKGSEAWPERTELAT